MLELLSLTIVVTTSSILGLFIIHNNPHSATNRSFSLFATAIIFWATIMYLSLHPPAPSQTLFFIRASMLAAILLTTTLLLLAHTFPSDTFTLKKKYLFVILSLSTIASAVAMSPYMFTNLVIKGDNIQPTPGPGMLLFLLSAINYIIISITILIRKYLKSHGRQKSQLRYILLGIFLMFSLLVGANFIIVVIFKSSSFIFLGPLFTLTFLTSTAYAITRHRLLEIRVLVTRTVTFSILTLAIGGFFAYALLLIPTFIPARFHMPASILVALLLAYTFNPLKTYLQRLTEDIFHKQGYSSDKLLSQLSDITNSTLKLDQITTKIIKQLQKTMHLTSAAFILFTRNDSGEKTLTTKSVDFDLTPKLTPTQITALVKKNAGQPVIFEDLPQSPTKELLHDQKISLAIPLKVKDTLHGLFVLGEKQSGDIYSGQDLSVLDIASPHLAVAIQNSLAYTEIKRFNATLRQKVKQATQHLRKANRDLRHLDKLKDEFVFVATHELKTPVAVLRGYLNMISDGSYGKVPDKMRVALTELESANQQLINLVNDLLEIARSEAKTIKIDTSPTLLCQCVDDTIKNLKTLADQKKLKLNHTCDSKKLKVLADPDRLQEILNNLISNAIKYSDKGSITITHVIEGKQVITHVADTGIGISTKDQKKVFGRFFRAQERAGSTPGTGLGLFIVKQLVEKMGGKIWFSSKLGQGTTFSFSLPKA